jgi:hypothetical protein
MMSHQALLGLIAAVVLALQAQAGHPRAPVIHQSADVLATSVCTGVDLNIGCQPIELTPGRPGALE